MTIMPIDYSKYPPNWKSEIRPAILSRANHKCEFCGLENHTTAYSAKINGKTHWLSAEMSAIKLWLREIIPDFGSWKPVKVVLTIAHLDHDETNHNVNIDRLAALCQLCHLRYDANEKAIRRSQSTGEYQQ